MKTGLDANGNIGFSIVSMPSLAQWSDETGSPAWKYPARMTGADTLDYYKRGARQLDALEPADMNPLIENMYMQDDGTDDAEHAHRLANMLARTDNGIGILQIIRK